MNKYWMAAVGGITAGLITSTQFALPSFAQEADQARDGWEFRLGHRTRCLLSDRDRRPSWLGKVLDGAVRALRLPGS